ncbi:hypothetical protein [Nonomuraea sp. NPDC049784]|uniref:hypothetical protein n=1 Tax=Nonomuraea sp. NPDC049784 TaxID=3154361 RepID=UPI0033CC326A
MTTPRHAAPPNGHQLAALPSERDDAKGKATALSILLAARHNIPAIVQTMPYGVVVRVFAGLIAHVDDVIWWQIPDITGTRERPLRTFAHTPAGAADRLAQHYLELCSVPIGELLRSGRIRLMADDLPDDVEVRRESL